jgi:hypothetical protein
MPKCSNLANEKIIKVVGNISFVMNEPSVSMNDGAEFAFFPRISFKVLQNFLLSLFI